MRLGLVVAGVITMTGLAGATAQAAPGDGIPDATYKVGTFDNCVKWGEAFVANGQYAGYACWADENRVYYIDLME